MLFYLLFLQIFFFCICFYLLCLSLLQLSMFIHKWLLSPFGIFKLFLPLFYLHFAWHRLFMSLTFALHCRISVKKYYWHFIENHKFTRETFYGKQSNIHVYINTTALSRWHKCALYSCCCRAMQEFCSTWISKSEVLISFSLLMTFRKILLGAFVQEEKFNSKLLYFFLIFHFWIEIFIKKN